MKADNRDIESLLIFQSIMGFVGWLHPNLLLRPPLLEIFLCNILTLALADGKLSDCHREEWRGLYG